MIGYGEYSWNYLAGKKLKSFDNLRFFLEMFNIPAQLTWGRRLFYFSNKSWCIYCSKFSKTKQCYLSRVI